MQAQPSKLEKTMEKLFPGIEFLTVSDTSFIPGTVIDSKRSTHKQGHIKSILKNLKSDYWETDRVKGNILAGETLNGTSDFNGTLSILSFLKVKSNVKSAYSYKYEIDSIEAMNFLNTSKLDMMPLLRKMKNQDKETWKSIKGLRVITETYYANKFSVTLMKNGNVASEIELAKDFDQISGEIKYEFTTDGKIVVAKNSEVPFGFYAFYIKDI